MENNLIGILQTKRDYVAFLQGPRGDSLAVDKNAELIPAIFQNIQSAHGENYRAVARDAAVGNREMVSHFAAANRKRRLGHGHRPAGVFRRNDFENGFAEGWGVWHRMTRRCKCITIIPAACTPGFRPAAGAQFLAAGAHLHAILCSMTSGRPGRQHECAAIATRQRPESLARQEQSPDDRRIARMSLQESRIFELRYRMWMVCRGAGVPPAIFPLAARCKNAGETPAPRKTCVPR